MIKKLGIEHLEEVKSLFLAVFTKEPWNDDWSDADQLDNYIVDLIGQSNSVTLGYFLEDEMVGLSMGRIKHWFSGTEYCIDELCIKREHQGKGCGTRFIKEMEEYCKSIGLTQIFLQTDQNVPAYEFYKKNDFFQLKEHVAFGKKFN